MTRLNSTAAAMTGDFGKLLSSEITAASVRSGNEWMIPLRQVTEAIKIAAEHMIAVLGVEVFQLSPHGHRTEGYTVYEFKLQGDWRIFVSQNNQAALQYIADHQFGDGYGYILTTTSAEEFSHLRDEIK
jgi:hypothetical protein